MLSLLLAGSRLVVVIFALALFSGMSQQVSAGPGDPSEDQPAPPPSCSQYNTIDSDHDQLTNCFEVTFYQSDPNDSDTDDDGMQDGTEALVVGSDPTVPDVDSDADGWADVYELWLSTRDTYQHPLGTCIADPNDDDTDDDRIIDSQDQSDGGKGGCGWNDSDNDGLLNPQEENYGTDPWDPDTDGDGFTDFSEVNKGADPLNRRSTP